MIRLFRMDMLGVGYVGVGCRSVDRKGFGVRESLETHTARFGETDDGACVALFVVGAQPPPRPKGLCKPNIDTT